MGDIYQDLLKDMNSIPQIEEVGSFDHYLSGEQVKMASIDDFFQFLRIGNNTLVHKAEKDLWRVAENDEGEVIIERLFDPSTKKPLRI